MKFDSDTFVHSSAVCSKVQIDKIQNIKLTKGATAILENATTFAEI